MVIKETLETQAQDLLTDYVNDLNDSGTNDGSAGNLNANIQIADIEQVNEQTQTIDQDNDID